MKRRARAAGRSAAVRPHDAARAHCSRRRPRHAAATMASTRTRTARSIAPLLSSWSPTGSAAARWQPWRAAGWSRICTRRWRPTASTPIDVCQAMLDADRAIAQSIAQITDKPGAATVALCAPVNLLASKWLIAWVGDCRVYRRGAGPDQAPACPDRRRHFRAPEREAAAGQLRRRSSAHGRQRRRRAPERRATPRWGSATCWSRAATVCTSTSKRATGAGF